MKVDHYILSSPPVASLGLFAYSCPHGVCYCIIRMKDFRSIHRFEWDSNAAECSKHISETRYPPHESWEYFLEGGGGGGRGGGEGCYKIPYMNEKSENIYKPEISSKKSKIS